MVHGVGIFLGFKREGAAVVDWVAELVGHAAVEEVAAVELETGLVGDDAEHAAGLGLVHFSDRVQTLFAAVF